MYTEEHSSFCKKNRIFENVGNLMEIATFSGSS